MFDLKFRGRPPVLIAKSVKGVANLTNEYAASIMNRATKIDEEFVSAILSQSIFSWEGRSPKPALDQDGNFRGTDLDLLSFLVPAVKRGAIIEIPEYRNRRKIVRKINERKIGRNSFGKAAGLVSNKDVFSFSVKIFDRTIAVADMENDTESNGAFRNYMIVDCNGHWYNGWNKIVWDPTAKENEFLSDMGLRTGNAISFRNYVHPNRKQSIYGAPYLLLKMLYLRLTDEADFYRREMKRLEALGIGLPEGEKADYAPIDYQGHSREILVETMEVALDVPGFRGKYRAVSNDQAGLVKAYRRQKHLAYTLRPMVQFVIRADEAAFYLFGQRNGFIANWMAKRYWKSGCRVPNDTAVWNQMVLSNDVAIRYCVKPILQEVSAE